jgi:hypothetical protein
VIERINPDNPGLPGDVIADEDSESLREGYCFVYHGARTFEGVIDVLDAESIKSPQRQGMEDEDPFRRGLVKYIEDIIRHQEGNIDGEVDLIEFAEQNSSFIEEETCSETQLIIEDDLESLAPFFGGEKLSDLCVW